MSAAAVTTRPSQALRQRRESQRPTLARTNTGKTNAIENGTPAKEEPKPYVITTQDILRKFNGKPPSLVIHLYPNNFRLNHSQDVFGYSSPMRVLIEHLRRNTVPHEILEELYGSGVPFYDNCLIVEVHDNKSSGAAPQSASTNTSAGNKAEPFSIHNYNSFITPSPFVPYPTKPKSSQQGQTDGQGKATLAASSDATNDDQETDKENMPAPGHPASATQTQVVKAPRVHTIVLFPTALSHDVDIKLLANTPFPDIQTYRRHQSMASSSRGGATPTMAHPPTPLTSVPPTPSVTNARSPNKQKMVLDETNVHEFEAEIINSTAPRLYLESTNNLEESVALIDTMTHPNYKNPPPAPKTRKRTTAELAADEAEAAETQRFILAGDERKSATTNVSANDENQTGRGGGPAFEPRFSRFKTLETIKMRHEESERRKKEEEARQAQAKRQQQAEAEAQKRREMEVSRQAEQHRAMQQHRQEQLLHQQQQQQQHLQQQEALRAASQAQQMSSAQPAQFPQPIHSQPQHSPPVIRQQTPLASSPSINTHSMASHPMASAPMAATSSSHGAGSPPRPTSAVSHHPSVSMTRQMSQQQSGQSASHHGTPQMVQGTPIMNQAIPARNMTPQPRINQQGSPSVGIQGTPGMMQTPQANLTPEMQLMLRQQQIARFQATQQAGMQKSPEQIAMFRAQQQISQLGVPPNQNPQVYQQALARQIQQQMANSSSPITSTSPQNAGQMRPTASQQGFPVPGQGSLANADSATLRATYNAHRQTLMQRYPGLVNVPQHMAQGMRQLENAIRLAETREHAGGQAGSMGQAGINGMNMGGQQPSAQQAAIQYQRMLQQQQQRVQTAQQQQQQQQLMAQMRGQQPGMQGMGMNGMGNIQQNQLMQGGMNMGNMQGMQGMQGMGGIGGMNMQNMQNIQMQMAAMQRQQAGQQRRGNEGMGDWSGV